MSVRIDDECWVYKVPFRVSRGAETALDVVVVTLTDSNGVSGRGEAAGVDYHGETMELIRAQIEAVRPGIEDALHGENGFAAVAALLPAGGARNAVDCALWDLRAKQRRTSVWEMAGFPNPRRLTTSITLGIDTDDAVSAGARRYADWPLIKVKVDAGRHLDAVRLVRAACPEADIIIDPNQAWSCDLLNRLSPELRALGVVLIEQPVPRAEDETLRGYRGSIQSRRRRVAGRPRRLGCGEGPVSNGEYQTRQERRTHGGACAGPRRPRPGTSRNGGMHGGYLVGDGAWNGRRTIGGVCGFGRAAAPCEGPRAQHRVRSRHHGIAARGAMGLNMSFHLSGPVLTRALVCAAAALTALSVASPAAATPRAAAAAASAPAAAPPPAAPQASAPYDVIIANGRVVDGTGSPWYSADIGIRDGQIAAIGKLGGAEAKQRIDAARHSGRARLHRHARAVGVHHPGRSAAAVEDLSGHHHRDHRRGRVRGAAERGASSRRTTEATSTTA